MELIKKIKQAETQAQEIIEQAKVQAARQAEQDRLSREQKQEDAEQERKKAIEASVSAAESDGLADVNELKAQAENTRQQMREKTSAKTTAAVAKVLDHLKG